ncbi:transcription factor HIVEP3 isoform X1 [Falco peregrinus]|uniref:transcription factor HIVEP3 isoform X1 n=1 Tax=Falco peregrinus TaxID=8954 RepID=UPI0006790785|nr:transcription factor HIVEP3 isoform X1 [Falco peregrinus]XP_055655353.1 transcription factor HIVEP3 isoform X1 [Falco peregrinus]XP_055655354.1 transcription factor HIVEP3 isoform X1 [Falco peregrinus]XP_055655355.1 transcription factor HIVEP3 isoform X1 [Falco peregrinus]XP_055655356.1 transcription factor HIVEP3 isoform X1 [Falco peregrinus]XP_055655357.1 transcription factor HIVEP3 isoform X1 [Falco peregrinus]XP_055655358.1 transcription factor HIVEP3 isoform X1 [Falco peregrinus]
MDPEQSQKSTKKAEESPRKRLPKGEAFQASISSAATYQGSSASSQGTPLRDIISQQHFSGSLPIPREESQEKTGHQQQPKPSSFEHPPHVSQLQQHALSPAFMSPGKPEHVLEGPTWQLVDPVRPGPSGSFSSPGLHSHHGQLLPSHSPIIPGEDMPSVQKVYIPRPSQVSLKQAEEVHKKEKKPQKPGKYICQYCSRPCAKPSVLQKHIRSHTGERPYPCIPCGFSFKTKSNLYKHRKSHAHRIKAGLASGIGAEMYPSSLEMERIGGEDFEEPTEGESTDSEEETGAMSGHSVELSPRRKHTLLSSSLLSGGSQGSSHDRCSLSHSSMSQSLEDSSQFVEPSSDHALSHKSEDTHTIKQKLALRLSERKKVIDEQAFLSPGSKGSTESGYFSRSESAEQQISPPNTNAKSYAEIIFGKCGRIGQRTAALAANTTQGFPHLSTEEKPSMVPLSVPRTQVIEHITKLITINEAVVDTSEIDSVKPRRSSLSRRSSIESPKSGVYREPFQFDIKSGSSSQLDASKVLTSHGEKIKPEQSLLSLQQSHSATETVPLLRSHSMPSAACTISSPHTFRGSYSFDDHIMEPEVLSRSQAFSSHPRMLKRQPAIELPLGVEYISEEVSSTNKETVSKPPEEPETKESDLTKKSRKGPKVKGFMYECNICGARYKKRDNYEAHKKYYCSELQLSKPHSSTSHTSSETEKSVADPDTWPQIMHYKLGSSLELTPLRKRRKEKSLGDDEEPPAFELSDTPSSSAGPTAQFANPASSDVALNLTRESIKSPADTCKSAPSDISGSFHPRNTKPASSAEGKERRTTSKEISVIQHTSSFEKSDSIEQASSLEEDKPLSQYSSQPPPQQSRPPHSLQPKLVRQPNIQVPEILVTEEPDRPETELEPPPKEPEKTEEFQWPQRSQTLSQLPAEKLPPKKKRLRLAEMAQSSGESSFESVSLTRSPSQESSISHSSSHSVSFDREDHSKSESSSQPSESHPKPPGVGSHMLMVPSHHHHSREMRRSASEQTPNVSHPSQMSETRSKSFDYGSLSSTPASTPGPSASSAPQERRKCFLVRQASLSRHPEHEPDSTPAGRPETEDPVPSSSKSPSTSLPHQLTSSSPLPSHGTYPSEKSQPKDSPPPAYTQPYTEALQVFHHPVPQLTLHEKQFMSPQVSIFPYQHLLPQPGQSAELFAAHTMSDILSAQFTMPQIPPSIFQSPPLPLPQTLIHPGPLHIAPPLMSHPADMPFRQHPSFLPVHYPGSSPIPSAFFLPLQSQFALQLPGEAGGHLPQIKSSIFPAAGTSNLSPCTEYGSDSRLHPLTCTTSPSVSVSTSQLVVPTRSDPMVSLVVPVRIQTNMPSYGSAMYTTLSQILVTQSQCSSSSIVLPKFDDRQPKGTLVCSADVHGLGFDLAQMITEDQRSIFQSPYLRVPLPLPERKGYMPLTSPSDNVLGLEGGPSTVGGSKRMLSPAGSLELTMETQQQKRVKEEEVSEAEEKLEVVKPPSAIEEGKKQDKSHFLAESQGRVEVETPPSLSLEQPEPKEIPSTLQQAVSHSGSPSFEALEEYKQPAGKQFLSKASLQPVKKEDSKELVEQSPPNPASAAPLSEVTHSAMKSREGTDMKKVLQFPSLHTTTNVSWCYLNYIKPNHIQQVDRRSSVYASWCISLYNPNLPGISTKAALSLLRSKQKVSKETYTMATAPRPEAGRLVPSSSRKPKMTEVHLPSPLSNEGRKDITRAEKEEDKRGKLEEEALVTKRGEPVRIKIFEGGYKSNEEYVYVRGRGRGKYVCEECGIRCKKPSMLKKHIRTHTDVRPYVCKYCNFAFKTKGNLTKHMKSKAHSKKCQEMGVLVSSLVDLEAEEGTSEDLFQDSEGREGSEPIEEHQFSDLEESDDDDDNEDEEDEEEEESQDEPPLKLLEGKHTTLPMHSSGGSPPSQEEGTERALSLAQETVSSSQTVGDGQQASSSGLETKWSADSSDIAVCHSFLSLHRPALTSTEQLVSAERESVTRPQMTLVMDLSTSKDTSPRKRWSPSQDSGRGGGSSRPMLVRKHLLTKNETSPKRFSPTGELSSLRCLSPGRGLSPCQRVSPRREASPLRCVSPRLELSPSRHLSPRRELSPRTYLPPEGEVSPARHSSPSREMSSVRYLSLKQVLSPGCSESSRYPSPRKEDLPGTSKLAADDKVQSSYQAQHGILSLMPLPHRFFGKNIELYESKLNIEPQSPTGSPGVMQPVCSRPLQAPHEIHVHAPNRGEENVFSHLPLHSQQLTRTPYPMIPIGGIQMVQARPSSHPSLVPSSVVSLQAGYFASGGSSFAEFSWGPRRDKGSQVPQELSSASVSPVAKVSKYTLSPELTSGGYLEEKTRTSELQQKTDQEEYRVKKFAESSHAEQAGCSASPASPSTSDEHSPKPLTSGEEPLKKTGKKQSGSSSTSFESSCTFISDLPSQPLDRSSSTGSLSEPSPSHSHSEPFSGRRRNLSGEPSRQGGTSRKSSPHLEHADLGQTQKKVDENTGST